MAVWTAAVEDIAPAPGGLLSALPGRPPQSLERWQLSLLRRQRHDGTGFAFGGENRGLDARVTEGVEHLRGQSEDVHDLRHPCAAGAIPTPLILATSPSIAFAIRRRSARSRAGSSE